MLSLDEKKAIQTVLLDEIYQRQESDPTLLLDTLLGDHGYQFVQHVLSRRATLAKQLGAMQEHLMRALGQHLAGPPPASAANGADPQERLV